MNRSTTRNWLLTLVAMLAVSAAAYGAFYFASEDAAMHTAAREGDAMGWLRTEFHLDDARYAAIKRLHDDYGVVCAEHCAAITEARHRAASPAEIAALEKTCVDAMTAHFRRVAALMPPAEGERYLATVLPRVAGYEHHGAPNVQVKP